MDACRQSSHGVGENCINATTAIQTMDKSLAAEGSAEEPELLGSVTHNQESDGTSTGLQIRSSARVSKKMRLDSIAAPVVPEKKAPAIPEKKAAIVPEKKEPVKDEEKFEPKQMEVKPRRRPWELWSQEDKNTFFDALNEFGKDFDSIQNYFATKARRKGLQEHMIKNKDQVRHFYYRSWHKVSKHLKFPEDVKKGTQELYSLINYGELRKKIGGFVSEKICMKLNELIYKGTTQIRLRGRTIRVKTPLCRALRKLNQLEECQEDLKLPARVSIELRPRTTEAWCRVQATSQNPRVQTVLPLQRRLTSLLAFLQHRWRMPCIKHRDHLLNSESCVELGHEPEEHCKERERTLRVAPRLEAQVIVPTLNITEYLTSSSLSLMAHGERMANRTDPPPPAKGKKGAKKPRQKENVRPPDEPDGENKMMVPLLELLQTVPTHSADVDTKSVNHVLSLEQQPDVGLQDPLKMEIDTVPSTSEQELQQEQLLLEQQQLLQQQQQQEEQLLQQQQQEQEQIRLLQQQQQQQQQQEEEQQRLLQQQQEAKAAAAEETIARARRGWTISDAHHVTIGEMYLMLVCPCGHVCGAPNKTTSTSKKTSRVTKPTIEVADKSGGSTSTSTREATKVAPAPKSRPLLLGKSLPLHDGVFRRPLLAPSMYKTVPKVGVAEAFKAQLDKFRPRYCNRRGRSVRPKSVLVQRMLPLLPKAPNGHAMVTLKVVPQTSQLSGEFMPIGTPPSSVLSFGPPHPGPSNKRRDVLPAPPPGRLLPRMPVPTSPAVRPVVHRSLAMTSVAPLPSQLSTTPILPKEPSPPHSPTSRMSSPPSISNLLDLELNSAVGDDISLAGVSSNGLLDVSLPTSSFVGLLPNESGLQPSATPPTSPSRILKEDNQWLNSEVADFSLSSFLGHLESPLKSTTLVVSTPTGEDTRLSSDVEAQLQCLMSENSVDYMAKFADLAAQIASEGANKK